MFRNANPVLYKEGFQPARLQRPQCEASGTSDFSRVDFKWRWKLCVPRMPGERPSGWGLRSAFRGLVTAPDTRLREAPWIRQPGVEG
jgi:hypothetical protein